VGWDDNSKVKKLWRDVGKKLASTFFFEYFERGEKSCDFSQRRKICLLVSFFIPDFWFFGLSAFVICYETFISLQLN
jgi:hypothetical protein